MTNGWRETALEEYRTLRAEAVASIGTQHTILGFGTATLGLVIGPGLALRGGSTLTFSVIFALFVPLFSAIIVTIWWGEVIRMVRAGNALACLELAINEDGRQHGWSQPALTWETNLRRSPPGLNQFVLNVHSVFGAFTLIAVVSTGIGLLKDYEAGDGIRGSSFVLSGVSLALGGLVALSAWARWKASKSEWETLRESRHKTNGSWTDSGRGHDVKAEPRAIS